MSEKKQEPTHPPRDTLETEEALAVQPRQAVKRPSLYKVFLVNDDYTPMDFVVSILEVLFSKNHEEATRIMMSVHQKGLGLCGVYTHEVAECKVEQVVTAARSAQHPLLARMEKE